MVKSLCKKTITTVNNEWQPICFSDIFQVICYHLSTDRVLHCIRLEDKWYAGPPVLDPFKT